MQKVENTDVHWEVYSTRIIELYSHVYFNDIQYVNDMYSKVILLLY